MARADVAPGPFQPNTESLKKHFAHPEWLQDAKFGIYTHWGPVTHAIQHPDETNVGRFGWYGKQIYTPGSGGFKYHEKYWGGTAKTGYKDICKQFKAEDFDADKWAEIFAMAGAKFAGPVSVHHDNFLMWDSELNPYCAGKMGPKRDICGEVAEAVRKRGMKFIGTFHHGFTYRYYEGAWKYDGKAAPELYGPERRPLPKSVKDKNGKRIKNPDWQKIPREWQEYWRDSVAEFVRKYQPDLIWFDFGLGWQDHDIQMQMYANYYNSAHAYGQPQPTVARKTRSGDALFHGTLDLERGHMPRLTAFPWVSDTSASAWFYYPNPTMQSDDSLVDMYVDIVAKNGALLLNIGPDYKGNIPEEFMSGLRALGAFNKLCGEGIYNTRPWLTYGEGVTRTSTGHKGAANSLAHGGSNFTSEDIRYTQSKDGNALYAFAMDWPQHSTLTLKSVQATATADARVELFGHGQVTYRINPDGTITIDLPKAAPNPHCNGFKLTGFELAWQPYGHFLTANATRIDLATVVNKGKYAEVVFTTESIPNATLLIGSERAAQGKVTLYDGKRKVVHSDYRVAANGKVEVGDFAIRVAGGKKAKPKALRLELTGVAKTDLTDLAIGSRRDKTIIQLGEPIQ